MAEGVVVLLEAVEVEEREHRAAVAVEGELEVVEQHRSSSSRKPMYVGGYSASQKASAMHGYGGETSST